ncbi:helix-hairpin-helix domain-containing protein [Bacillus sp. FJAT-47783]|uniref:helix-hairpin-helix domain-containing protein n=1 Tax=Bacillus sp. FJAT-47783 TaxID=2922712 RepID=UPI0024350F59|nr:helix-hairpin-helix domain-containing protein [Bacillus sp. FJAT-47783]
MEMLLKAKKYWFIPLLIVFVVFVFYGNYEEKDKNEEGSIVLEEAVNGKIETETTANHGSVVETIFIDVKGAVQKPGVYELKKSERVLQAIEKAGGFLQEADVNKVNLAAKLEDGTVIYVPKMGEEESVITTVEAVKSVSSSKGININTATLEELQTLNGIGPSKAEAIISYREENGPFSTIEDIKKVSGIGDKSFEKIKNDISID